MEKATREQTKSHNTRLVLKTVYREGDTSRADIARITNLTRTTVSDIVAELIDSGLLVETGTGESAGGKPPIVIRLEADARKIICLDLSGAPFTGAVANLRGEICQRQSAGKPGELSGEAALQAVFDLLDALVPVAGAPILGIGIGVPGIINLETGEVRRSVRLGWDGLPLKKLVEARCQLPVYLSNDAHAAALAEYTFGDLRDSANLIAVRIVEGIGSGILLSGQIHHGDGFGAGEIGHLTVVEGGRQCSCGNYGCLETVASPPALVQRMRELAEYEWVSFAGKTAPEDISWDFVRRAFKAGDETVLELIKEAGRYVGVSIANLVSILSIRRVVISGSYGEFGSTFLDAVSGELKRRSLLMTALETQIVNSKLDPDTVLLGVSALVLSKEMGLP